MHSSLPPVSHALCYTHTVSGFSFMLQSELQGEQQLEETERVPDNYPYRLPPLSGRKEHTQSIMRGSCGARKDTDITAHSTRKEDS